jgi:hypothetical protein
VEVEKVALALLPPDFSSLARRCPVSRLLAVPRQVSSLSPSMVPAAPPLDAQYQAPSLSFSVTPSSSHSHARSGTLVFMPVLNAAEGVQSAAPRVIETPASIAYSRKGALPHLTRDNVARLPNEMVHLSLEHL